MSYKVKRYEVRYGVHGVVWSVEETFDKAIEAGSKCKNLGGCNVQVWELDEYSNSYGRVY